VIRKRLNLKTECGQYNVVNTPEHRAILTIIGTEMIDVAN
jgi:hypothetical protein